MDILDILKENKIPVKKAGNVYFILCPFHPETKPSCAIYPDHFHCYGCGEHGSLKKLLKALKIQPPVSPFPQIPSRPRISRPPEDVIETLTSVTQLFHQALFRHSTALDYVLSRGISIETIKKMKIGFSPKGLLLGQIARGKIELEALEKAMLVRKGKEFFRNRIVFPEVREGKTIYMAGRALYPHQSPKYLFLPKWPKVLFGWGILDKSSPEIYIVEGFFDLATLIEWGYPALALGGITLKNVYLPVFYFFSRVYVIFDSDTAGQLGASKIFSTLPNVKVISLPLEFKDVNEIAQKLGGKGKELFESLLEGK